MASKQPKCFFCTTATLHEQCINIPLVLRLCEEHRRVLWVETEGSFIDWRGEKLKRRARAKPVAGKLPKGA